MTAAVVVTGIGVISALGRNAAEVTASLAGNHIRRRMVKSYPPGHNVTAAALPEEDFSALLGGRGLKYHARATHMLALSCLQALQSAAFDPDGGAPLALMVGSALGNHSRITRYMRLIARNGPDGVQPMDAVDTTANSPVDFCAVRCRVRGAVKMIATGACSSLDAIIEGARWIAGGRAQQVLAAGFETLYPEMLATLEARQCMGPAACSESLLGRPYCRSSQGMIPGEGAAALLLENEQAALCRGVPILARVFGGDSVFAPGERPLDYARGIVRAGRQALATADCPASFIDWVCGSANGVPATDRGELLALKQLFGRQRRGPAINSFKAGFGETLGAGGALTTAAVVGCLSAGFIPPTVGLEKPWPEAGGLDLVTGAARLAKVGRLLILSADADGFCSAIVIGGNCVGAH